MERRKHHVYLEERIKFYGFVKYKSCHTNLSETMDTVTDALNNGHKTLVPRLPGHHATADSSDGQCHTQRGRWMCSGVEKASRLRWTDWLQQAAAWSCTLAAHQSPGIIQWMLLELETRKLWKKK